MPTTAPASAPCRANRARPKLTRLQPRKPAASDRDAVRPNPGDRPHALRVFTFGENTHHLQPLTRGAHLVGPGAKQNQVPDQHLSLPVQRTRAANRLSPPEPAHRCQSSNQPPQAFLLQQHSSVLQIRQSPLENTQPTRMDYLLRCARP
jgi:hypothetical protein